jgi:threonine/homoserine/homoserine lactone efflux protein
VAGKRPTAAASDKDFPAMTLSSWLLYLAAVLVLTVTPGPSVLMCVSTSVNLGARKAMLASLGSTSAIVGLMSLSALGLGAALAASETLFTTLKWLGAVYLAWLGISSLLSSASEITVAEGDAAASGPRLFGRGFLVGASNPKALLFFTAFFPQFIDPAAPQMQQFLILGGTFVAFELFWLMFYASFAARLAPWLRAPGRARWFNRLAGGTFMGAGVLLATVKQGHD